MTVKEIESRSGLTRANIRFYETEGLIDPRREKNGYRDYSEADLDELLRIKLLRSLDFSLEDIREMKEGKRSLTDAMKSRIAALHSEQSRLNSAEQVCNSILTDRPSYLSMDTKKYFEELERGPVKPRPLVTDIPKRIPAPWKRYFARSFDLAIYGFIFDLILLYAFGLSIFDMGKSSMSVLSAFVSLVMMFFTEPLLLSTWGTTPGKWILGLYVRDKQGEKLSYEEGQHRIQRVLLQGMGLNIPGYSLFRLWRSYNDCWNDTLDWEIGSTVHVRDSKKQRYFIYAGACILLFLGALLALVGSTAPKNRGDLTKAELIENYNHYVDYYGISNKLTEEGRWDMPAESGYTVELGIDRPNIEIVEENGRVVKVISSYEMKNSEKWAYTLESHIGCMFYSFARAGKGYFPLTDKTFRPVQSLSYHPFEDFEFEAYGVRVTGEYEYEGYLGPANGTLFPEEGKDNYFRCKFVFEKTD